MYIMKKLNVSLNNFCAKINVFDSFFMNFLKKSFISLFCFKSYASRNILV